jgi:hypothetical protein
MIPKRVGRADPDPPKKVGRAEKGAFTIPKNVAAAGDLLYTLREQRLEIEAQANEVMKKEAQVREFIINNLPKQGASGVRGRVAQVRIEKKDVPTAKDWAKIQAYIRKNDAFDLMQRRLNDAAVKARWEEGKKVPGVEKFSVVTVSCTKLGEK